MAYPKNTPDVFDLPDLYYDAKERMARLEDEVRNIRGRILATGKTIIIGRRYRVTIDSVGWRSLDEDRLRMFVSDKIIEDCMQTQPRTFVRLKSLSGKTVKLKRGAGRQGEDRVSDDE
jgi:hypothetical protein